MFQIVGVTVGLERFLDVGTIPVLDGIRFLGLPLYDADQLGLLRFGIMTHCNESLSKIWKFAR